MGWYIVFCSSTLEVRSLFPAPLSALIGTCNTAFFMSLCVGLEFRMEVLSYRSESSNMKLVWEYIIIFRREVCYDLNYIAVSRKLSTFGTFHCSNQCVLFEDLIGHHDCWMQNLCTLGQWYGI